MTTADLAKLKKADLIEEIEKGWRKLVEQVDNYPEGCEEGRVDFLRACGVPDEIIAETYTLPSKAPETVVITLAFRPNDPEQTPESLIDEVICELDASDVVNGSSTYCIDIRSSQERSVQLQMDYHPDAWSEVGDYEG